LVDEKPENKPDFIEPPKKTDISSSNELRFLPYHYQYSALEESNKAYVKEKFICQQKLFRNRYVVALDKIHKRLGEKGFRLGHYYSLTILF
jgi:hypothetical protein